MNFEGKRHFCLSVKVRAKSPLRPLAGRKNGRSAKSGGRALKLFNPLVAGPNPSHAPVSKRQPSRGSLDPRKADPKCTSIIARFCWSSAMYTFWSMTDRNSGSAKIFNGPTCHRSSWQRPSDPIQGPPGSTTERKVEVERRRLVETHPKTHLHSLHAAYPKGDPHKVLPHF